MAADFSAATSDGIWVWVCDNYLVTERGVESLHKSPQEIFEIEG